MRAFTVPTPGGPEALTLTELLKPEPSTGEVLVKVHATGVNRADVLQRQGFYNPPAGATPVLGLEAAGVIEALGDGVIEALGDGVGAAAGAGVGAPVWKVGDRVAVLLTGGGYAEYVTVPAGHVLPVPESLSLTEAAALPEALITVYSNLVDAAGLVAGDWVLVHGGGSGIGTTAIQVVKRLGAHIAVTVGSAEKAARCLELGADAAINYKTEDFVARVQELTQNRTVPGVDIVLDIIGAKYLERNLRALTHDGRLVVIGMQGGTKAQIDLGVLLPFRRSIMGTTLRARTDEQKASIVARVRAQLWPDVISGDIAPVVDSTFAFEDVAQAHARMEESSHFGKIVVKVAQ